jgi:hypothetical protein
MTSLAPYLAAAATVAVLHTLQGPDHYVPFIVLRKARGWSLARTVWVTLLCGVGHCGSSVALAFAAAWGASRLFDIDGLQDARGDLASWALIAIGLFLVLAGIKRSRRHLRHSHFHLHADGSAHVHAHDHHSEHAHAHPARERGPLLVWSLFIVFVLGPCEWLIPNSLAAYHEHGMSGLLLVSGIFSAATVMTMLAVVLAASEALSHARFDFLRRHATTMAGAAILLSGASTLFLGL